MGDVIVMFICSGLYANSDYGKTGCVFADHLYIIQIYNKQKQIDNKNYPLRIFFI